MFNFKLKSLNYIRLFNTIDQPLFWFFLILQAYFLHAQELPPIENFTPIEYAAENQNWGISQSKEKNIYIANNGGLLEFNGTVWQLYGSPNGSPIRSVQVLNELVYTGCYMEFGFWKKNDLGDLQYTSLSTNLKAPLLEDEEFWNILELDDWVLFQSLERIYIYNTTDKSLNIIESPSTKAQMFNFEGTIYFHSTGTGLFKIENGKSVLVTNDPNIKESVVSGFFSIQDKQALVTEKGDFYFVEEGNLQQWKIPFKDNSETINVYSSIQLDDGSLVLGTISNGIYHIGENGMLLQKINQEKGLNNNTVLGIFEDFERNLWLALDNGISVVNINSPFKEYIDKNGTLGVVYASAEHNNYRYLGTNQGLFYKRTDVESNFKLINGTQGQVWLLKRIDDALFCGHNNGTYIIKQSSAQLISDFPGTWNIKPIPNKKHLLLQGNYNGLSVLERRNENWVFRNAIKGFDISSRFFEFIGVDQIAVNREFKGIFKLNVDQNYTKVLAIENEASKGIGASLAAYEDEVLYACSNGIYRYNQKQLKFVVDSILTHGFYQSSDKPVGIFIPDAASKRLWCFTDQTIAFASPGKFDATSTIGRIAIPTDVRKNLGVLGFENLTPIANDRYLIGISNGYLTIDLKKLPTKEYRVKINSIARKSNVNAFSKIPKKGRTKFSYAQNNLFFSYNVPEFDKYTEVTYQYQLKGMYDNWSDWGSTANVSFENLPFGNYSFRVRAKVGNDLSTNEAVYDFRIERPWYLSNVAIFLYVLGFVLLALLIHKLYKNYYKKQREQLLRDNKKQLKRKKLKAQKKIVQLNNEKLKEEVESKNRELAISTMSIIKKNEFLNSIKDQLKASGNHPEVKAVIRTIDRNINNEDDWKFFEDAFNNADKDFLKKVKSLHPELTSNDLRLCAYLRLNLSSKEIAPLLNISVRSVEVKRYRLRKKMNLTHESGLTSYMMEI